MAGRSKVELLPERTLGRYSDENSVNVSGAVSGIFYTGRVSTVNRLYLSLFACGQMLFHLWLFTVQNHERLHSEAPFSSQTGHPYFCAESNENIDGLRYCGCVWRKPTTVRYIAVYF